jgi:hypothetical protein
VGGGLLLRHILRGDGTEYSGSWGGRDGGGDDSDGGGLKGWVMGGGEQEEYEKKVGELCLIPS